MALGEPTEQALNDVSTVLWRERQLLELLVFKLEEEQLLLSAARPDGSTMRRVRSRSSSSSSVPPSCCGPSRSRWPPASWDWPATPGCAHWPRRALEPWSSIFAKHRQAFLELTQEVRELSERNRHLLAKGRDAAREALNWLTGKGAPPPQAYTASGGPSQAPAGHLLVNEAI